jgi:hypothetical protein
MLTYELIENKKVISITNDIDDKKIEYALGGSISILNKFDFIINLSKAISETKEENLGEEYNKWLWKILHDYEKAYNSDKKQVDTPTDPRVIDDTKNKRYNLLKNNITKIKYFVDKFYTVTNFDFKQFTAFEKIVRKASNKTILFDEKDIKDILYVSSYMKIYCLISYSTKHALGLNLHRQIYNELIADFIESDVVEKIYNVVKTKTYKYNMTDKAMWEYLKNFQGKSIDAHIGETFNFLLNNILVFCEYDKNPITFMVIVINNNSRWVLHSIYVHNIQYEGTLSTEDIHTITSDNLKTYAYNQTLGQLKTLAYQKIQQGIDRECRKEYENDTEPSDEKEQKLEEEIAMMIVDTNSRIDNITTHSPIHHCLTFPLLSEICEIPYYHMKTIDTNHACVLSMYLRQLLQEVFQDRYHDFFEILNYGTKSDSAISTTFQLKHGEKFINMANKYNFYTFKSKSITHKLINHFIGVLSRNKDGYINLKTGEVEKSFSISKIEPDIIQFYIYFWDNIFEKEFKMIRKRINNSL